MIVYMKVLITGGTGFVGSHAVAAIAGSGHELRLLVRRPEQLAASLDPLGWMSPTSSWEMSWMRPW
jgi:nucleoside-diphosphate-sugar epimerase